MGDFINQKCFQDIPGYRQWKEIQAVDKGYSKDQKYHIITNEQEHLLLRCSLIKNFFQKEREYQLIRKIEETGITMTKPVSFGICNEGQWVYLLLTWVEGVDLEEVLGNFPVERQYELGRQAGNILRMIHQISLNEEENPIDTKISKKLLQLEKYEHSLRRVENDEEVVNYVKQNIQKIWREKPTYLHGDFHPGNLIYQSDGTIGVIDFNRWEIGDPYEEFYKLESYGVELSVPYCIGQIESYFNDQVPEQFWETLSVYVAHASLYSIEWATQFDEEEIIGMVQRYHASIKHFDHYKQVVPTWYKKNLGQ